MAPTQELRLRIALRQPRRLRWWGIYLGLRLANRLRPRANARGLVSRGCTMLDER